MPKIRLYVPQSFLAGSRLQLSENQSHYVANVMRCREGDRLAIFNGQDGEWLVEIVVIAKKAVTLGVVEQRSAQRNSPDLWLAFAPIKNKTDLVIEKAIELGVSAILPVYTRYAVVRSINADKLAVHAIEAAEQCERHDVPVIREYKDLTALLAAWPQDRTLLYGDESGSGESLKQLMKILPPGKYAILIGPEGGFAPEEHELLKSFPLVTPFSMGPRILRADTAAVAALACVQAWLGDWEERPRFES